MQVLSVNSWGAIMDDRLAAIASVARLAITFVAASLLVSCAVIKLNHDGTNSIEHSGGAETGEELAGRACAKARALRAEVVSTVKKDGNAPQGKERYVTTFRCIY